ncbi:protein Daple-like isoform X2 [Anthonomus grandis grandis]|nr:protein Daple-like isoform X2 [Anthonomus grandis grandis]
MLKPDEDAPLIYLEARQLLEDIESSDGEIQESESLLEARETYNMQLQQHCASLEKSLSEKGAQFAILKSRTSYINNLNTSYRDKGKEILEVYNTADQEVKELETIVAESEQKDKELEKIFAKKTTHYEKEIDDLTKLLNQLTEKRKKQLVAVELETKKLEEENLDLNHDLMKLEYEEKLYDETLKDSSELEIEVETLQDKLKILKSDHLALEEEEKSLGERQKEIMAEFSEEKYGKMNTSLLETSKEIEDLQQVIQKDQAELVTSSAEQKDLADYEEKLDKELAEAQIAFQLLDTSRGEISKLNQAIDAMKADINERRQKYGSIVKEKDANTDILKEAEDKIVQLTPEVDLIVTGLNEVEILLKDLGLRANIAEQFEETSHKVEALDKEIGKLQEREREKENLIETYKATMAKYQEKFDLELLTLNNAHSMEIKDIEAEITQATNSKIEPNEKVKTANDEINQLEETLQRNEENLETTKKNNKKLNETYQNKQQGYKTISNKNKELIKSLDLLKPPQEVPKAVESARKLPTKKPSRERSADFMRPKTPESRKLQPIPKHADKSNRDPRKSLSRTRVEEQKRNWDSDSSVEEDSINFKEFIANKKKRQESKEAAKPNITP